ncbi:MAG TPA: response regulator [Prolixibacteraceae bacterium]|jgi:DNA-binding NarL/FixJ family response regulator
MNVQKKILVIDGDQNFSDTIEESLTFHKYNVCCTSNVGAGVQKALEYNPDLILCDIDPTDGFHVYTVLNQSLTLKKIPFIFLKKNATIEDIRHGMNLGADDFLSKPISIADIVKTIEIRLQKFESTRAELAHEFNTLFELSPIGILLFSEHTVIRANQSMKALLKIDNQESIPLKIKELFESSSLLSIKNWIQQSLKGVDAKFNGQITLKDIAGNELPMNLVISVFTSNSSSIYYIGFFAPISPVKSYVVNDQLANQVCNLLKREKMTLPDGLEEKIIQIINDSTVNSNEQDNSFFTKRENQVLRLSMEGFPIKIIADKLDISARTVEKYRTKLMEKSGTNNIVEVIVFSLKNGLIKI